MSKRAPLKAQRESAWSRSAKKSSWVLSLKKKIASMPASGSYAQAQVATASGWIPVVSMSNASIQAQGAGLRASRNMDYFFLIMKRKNACKNLEKKFNLLRLPLLDEAQALRAACAVLFADVADQSD